MSSRPINTAEDRRRHLQVGLRVLPTLEAAGFSNVAMTPFTALMVEGRIRNHPLVSSRVNEMIRRGEAPMISLTSLFDLPKQPDTGAATRMVLQRMTEAERAMVRAQCFQGEESA